jgi:hypothetical protein
MQFPNQMLFCKDFETPSWAMDSKKWDLIMGVLVAEKYLIKGILMLCHTVFL